MADFLARMAGSSRDRVEAARATEPLDALRERALATPAPPALRASATGFDLIAEIKERSPSAGALLVDPLFLGDVAGRAAMYAQEGAAAISVLTEPDAFGGSLSHLEAAASASPVPVMRKDFLVDPYQVYEARAAGAGGVLAIVRIVDDATLQAIAEAAAECGQFVLVECFDLADLALAREICSRGRGRMLIGVNCRDLVTLAVRPERFSQLRMELPGGVLRVAESGCDTPDDVAQVAALGYDMALVGSALMRADAPASLLRSMLAAGRAARVDA